MTTMWRWQLEAAGRDNLALVQVPVPTPGPGELLVRVAAVALNYRDKLMIATGMGQPVVYPLIPGSDMAGTVVAAGKGVTRFAPGDRVISTFNPDWIDAVPGGDARTPPFQALGGTCPGVLADYVCFPQGWFVRAPATLDDAGASTLPCAGLTAWFALVERGRVHAGQTVLVTGTGGVALFGVQIAKAQGATVFVTSGSPDKFDRVRALGADHVVDRRSGDWVETVLAITGDRGIDHILELVGGPHLAQSLAAVAVHGRISVIGLLGGSEISAPVGPLLLKSPVVQGISVGHRRALEDLVAAIDAAGIVPVIDARYAMADLPAALDHIDAGPFGKLVIDVG